MSELLTEPRIWSAVLWGLLFLASAAALGRSLAPSGTWTERARAVALTLLYAVFAWSQSHLLAIDVPTQPTTWIVLAGQVLMLTTHAVDIAAAHRVWRSRPEETP